VSASENGRTVEGLAERHGAPKLCQVTAILVARDESFRQHLYQRLLQADCEDVRVVEPSAEFAPLLIEYKDAMVVLGGRWPELRPFLRTTVSAKALAVVVLQQRVAFDPESPSSNAPAPLDESWQRTALCIDASAVSDEGAREALEMGACAVLHAGVSKSALKAALTASHAGLIVLDRAFEARREAVNPDQISERSHGTVRQLTIREREILSLVASGVSNKGVARSLGVSVNTVKFHLGVAFEKLNAATRAEAVTEAIRRGELSL
jgi:DNA-binding NarL/FixJ family response regulator